MGIQNFPHTAARSDLIWSIGTYFERLLPCTVALTTRKNPEVRDSKRRPIRGLGTSPRLRRRLGAGALAAWLLLCAGPTAADTSKAPAPKKEAAETELKEIRSRIKALTKRLGKARTKHGHLENQLRDAEVEIGAVARELKIVTKKLRLKRRRLDELGVERKRQEALVAAHREALRKQIRASYAMGRRDYLKILLNQEDPAKISRVLTYYRYFNEARARRIEAANKQLDQLEQTRNTIQQETRALEALRSEKTAMRSKLETGRKKRAAVLKQLDAEIAQGGQQLAGLEQDESRLKALVVELQRVLADIPKTLDDQKPFATLKGKLSWPAPGAIVHAFGTRRRPGNLKWQGVWLSGRAGEPIRAVYHGRVAFAGWLRGFGLLLIVDHGDGYMSLYGHGQSLYKETGDWVEPGEVVASIGNSGGNLKSGLYFEIRRKGVPVNPKLWCKKRPPGSRAAL